MATLQEIADYCAHFNCYAEYDGDRQAFYLYYHNGDAVGAVFSINGR